MSESTERSLSCATCGGAIYTGQPRVPSGAGAKHERCQLRDDLREEFTFYITNPLNVPDVSFSLWRHEGNGREYPVLTRTGRLTSFQSTRDGIGDGIEPTPHFFTAIAHTHHWLMCLMNGVDHDEIDQELERAYPDGKVPDHERWAIHQIVGHFHPPTPIMPEFVNLREYVSRCTDFGVPPLVEDQVDD